MSGIILYLRILLSKTKSQFLIDVINNKYILSRTACLVNDSLFGLEKKFHILNFQKLRLDYLISNRNNFSNKIDLISSLRILRPIIRSDIKYIVMKSINYWLPRKAPQLILIDNYSELTDQEFISIEEKFYCGYSDINQNNDLKNNGLYNLDNFQKDMNQLVNFFSIKYPTTKIFYFIFPDVLETRKKFIQRRGKILKVVEKLSLKYLNFEYIPIPDDLVIKRENDKHKYHYNKEVYTYINKKITESL